MTSDDKKYVWMFKNTENYVTNTAREKHRYFLFIFCDNNLGTFNDGL